MVHYYIFIAVLIIYCSEELQVFCYNRKLERPFDVNENQAEVEQLVFDATKKNFFNSLLKKTGLSRRQEDRSSRIISVCDLQFPTRLALCKAILDMSYFGFTFHSELPEYQCKLEKIYFKQPHCDEAKIKCWGKKDKPPKKKLFRCPPLQYKDLETDEVIVVPLEHFISDSSLPGSYFSYLEENGFIYPQKYAYNVNVESIGTVLRDEHRGSVDYQYVDVTRESSFLAMKKIKELGTTYEKFMRTFKSNNVCGLKKAHVISLCREFLQDEFSSQSHGIFHQGYDEAVCQRRLVFFVKSWHHEASYGSSMAILKCPPSYKVENGKKIFLLNLDYLSMGLKPRSFMRYHRYNLKMTEIRLSSVIYKSGFDTLEEDERRIREFMEPGYVLRLQGGIIDEPASPFYVSSPENGPVQLIFHRSIVEDSTMNFMKLKLMKKPYERFSITVGITSVFMMNSTKFSKTCRLILKNRRFGFSFSSTKSDFPRKTEDSSVKLALRDAESLPIEKLRIRECPPVSDLLFRHYMTSSTEKNGALIYEKYRVRDFVVPIALRIGENARRVDFNL